MNMQIILASQSPRRKELLAEMGIEFVVVASAYEEVHDESRPTTEVVKELSLGKARDVAQQYPDAVVIGSDTIVEHDGKQLGKPKDTNEAIRMLTALNGNTHAVVTGVAMVCLSRGIERAEVATTRVVFKHLSQQAIHDYVATGDPMDKAGAYGIQSKGGFLVDHLEGDMDTVIGFPTRVVREILKELGAI